MSRCLRGVWEYEKFSDTSNFSYFSCPGRMSERFQCICGIDHKDRSADGLEASAFPRDKRKLIVDLTALLYLPRSNFTRLSRELNVIKWDSGICGRSLLGVGCLLPKACRDLQCVQLRRILALLDGNRRMASAISVPSPFVVGRF